MTIHISTHAIKRYQERIENVPLTEVCRRLRAIVTGNQIGPRVDVRMRDGAIITVYPVGDTNVTRALKNGSWK